MMGKRWAACLAAVTLAVPLAGCGLFGGGDGDKSPSPSKPTKTESVKPGQLPDPVASKLQRTVSFGTDSGSGDETFATWEYEVLVYGVYRHGDYATLLMGARLVSSPKGTTAAINLAAKMKRTTNDSSDVGGPGDDLTLLDTKQMKAHLVARDAKDGGACLCPDAIRLAPGSPLNVFTAEFAAPPGGTKSVDVSTPSTGYFPDVPVTEGTAPRLDEDSEKYVVDDSESDGKAARADVVPISGQVSNSDQSVTKSRDKVTLAADVLFDFDKATLTPAAKSRLADAAATLKEEAKGQRVQVNGYTDSKGSNSYNAGLSDRRAKAVQKALEPMLEGSGITLVPAGKGEASPVAPNTKAGEDNPAGRKLNRRVEIVYRK